MAGSKKGKYAKDGGVVAAVTKQAAGKFTNGSANKNPSSNPSSPPLQSPDIQPTLVPSYNGNPTTAPSPALDALSTTSTSNDWMRGGLSGSPGNLISLTGESPPTQPSSYEDQGRLHHHWAAQRQYMSPQPASPSPPNSMRRPLSFQPDGSYAAPEMRNPMSSTPYRRGSVASQYSHNRVASHPPLPHQPQAHFYGAPDLDLESAANKMGLKAGERSYYFGFDAYPRRQVEAAPGSDSVVVAGYEGGLEVYSVSKRGLECTASLKGLRGGVLDAKILPWTSADGPDIYPLVAVVIHGPVLPDGSTDSGTASGRPGMSGSPRTDAGLSIRATNQPIEYYQTSVEVYSLKTNQRVDVLLQAPRVQIKSPVSITSTMFVPPLPTGFLNVRADGGVVVVSSGLSGECWVYRQFQAEDGGEVRFCIMAKLWTSIQQSRRSETSEENDRSRSPVRPQPTAHMPILALNGRWLSYCPPSPSSQMSLRAHVPVPVWGKAPGIQTVTVPQLPSVLSVVDPISESKMNKLMRETTQELIHGAKWVGQQGMQAWNAYWNKTPSQPQQARSPPLPAQQWGASYPPRLEGPQFPPTHGTPGKAVTKDPGLVSVVDLDTLGSSTATHPLTTFATPEGCSFLSFSPNGLSLFTASSKGDVQDVWDLMRIQYTKSSPLQVSSQVNSTGPRVRQIAHFTRMTVARIVHVAWTKPNGERIAMVTERGTVHLLDMPSSAFSWPPPRRRRDAQETNASSEQSSSAVSMASNALGAAFGAARPLVSRSRRSSANSGGPTAAGSNTIVDSASHGGRVIAASISSSIGKTGNAINQLRHTGENRVSLPPSTMIPTPGCVAWITGRHHHALFVASAGLVRTFPSKVRAATNRTPRGNTYKDFKVPVIPDDIIAETIKRFINGDEDLYLSDRDLDAGNTVTLEGRGRAPQVELPEASIPQAEIESSAPYQPFHTDRRVVLYEYSAPVLQFEPSVLTPQMQVQVQVQTAANILADTSLEERAPTPPTSKKKKKQQQQITLDSATPPISQVPSSTDLNISSYTAPAAMSKGPQPWAFGQKITSTRLDLGLPPLAEEPLGLSDDGRALPASAMERVLQVGENDEQIVVTTRRRRGARHEDMDDGFFEDDCEVLDFADQRV